MEEATNRCINVFIKCFKSIKSSLSTWVDREMVTSIGMVKCSYLPIYAL